MTETPETVAVPVEYIRRMERALREEGFMEMADQAKGMLPKPRLIAVTRDQWSGIGSDIWYDEQPDLLLLIEKTISSTLDQHVKASGWSFRNDSLSGEIVARIRTALGVSA